jgi:hypothetical protein
MADPRSGPFRNSLFPRRGLCAVKPSRWQFKSARPDQLMHSSTSSPGTAVVRRYEVPAVTRSWGWGSEDGVICPPRARMAKCPRRPQSLTREINLTRSP